MSLLLSSALALSIAGDLPVLHDDLTAPRAWLAVADASLWVCWDGPDNAEPRAGAPDECWRPLPLLDDLAEARAVFLDPDTLIVAGSDEAAWVVRRGGEFEAAPAEVLEVTALAPLNLAACSLTGWLPRRDRGVWSWHARPCEAAPLCQHRPITSARPSGLAFRLGVAATWRLGSPALGRAVAGTEIVASIEFGLDPGRLRRQQEQRRALDRAAARAPSGAPAPRSRGVLAEAERRALATLRCSATEGAQ